MSNVTLQLLATADTDAIRRENFKDVEHLVVPIIALVEGVIKPGNSPDPELALVDEFGKHPGGWDGRPIVLNHPRVNGQKVPANSPEVLEREAFGMLFNTTVDGKKLKTEAWINLDRVKELGGDVATAVERLESGDIVEVSTGLFSSVEMTPGTFDGKKYEGIWRNVVPDHLAILPEGVIGACSVEDGCGGPRLNSAGEICLKSLDQCNPAGCACRDAQRTREQSKMTDDSSPSLSETEIKSWRGIFDKFKHMFGFKVPGEDLVTNDEHISDRDTRVALDAALESEDPSRFHEVVAVFSSKFVYAIGFGGTLHQRTFEIADDSTITLGSEVTQVRPVTEFVPVNVAQEKENMATNKERVNALIANKRTRFTDDDSKWLKDLSETQLEALEPVEQKPEETLTPTPKTVVVNTTQKLVQSDEGADDGKANEKVLKAQTAQEYVDAAPPEVKEALNEAMRTQSARRGELVEKLVDNQACDFSKEELSEMSIPQLEKLAKLARIPDFSGASGPVRTNATEDDTPPEAPEAFPRAVTS